MFWFKFFFFNLWRNVAILKRELSPLLAGTQIHINHFLAGPYFHFPICFPWGNIFLKILVTTSFTFLPLQVFQKNNIELLAFFHESLKNIFVLQNNCGQDKNKVGKNFCFYWKIFKLQPVEYSAGCLYKGFGLEACQQSCKVCNWERLCWFVF